MEIKELQIKVDELIKELDKRYNCEHNVNNTFMHLIEELGELSRELNKPNIRNEEINKKELSKEISDVFMLLTRVTNIYNINLEESIINKIEEIKGRK